MQYRIIKLIEIHLNQIAATLSLNRLTIGKLAVQGLCPCLKFSLLLMWFGRRTSTKSLVVKVRNGATIYDGWLGCRIHPSLLLCLTYLIVTQLGVAFLSFQMHSYALNQSVLVARL